MTKQERLYNKLIKEFPQLATYTTINTTGDIDIGLTCGEYKVTAISVSDYTTSIRWAPEPRNKYVEYTWLPDVTINALKSHIDEMLKMIQDFEKTANSKREFNLLRQLGWWWDPRVCRYQDWDVCTTCLYSAVGYECT